ncbi:MAG: GNAT family N-acetyltransferase [Hyphomicrobiaceae bacterium]
MSELLVRRATPADAALVRASTRRAYAKWVAVVGREPRPMTADYERAVTEHLIDLAEIEGRHAGLIEMKPEADHLLIVNVAVEPERQGQGLGSRLLAHAEDVARRHGLPELRLYTNGAMASNIALYRRRGYREDRREVTGPLGVAVYMSKRLATPPCPTSRK